MLINDLDVFVEAATSQYVLQWNPCASNVVSGALICHLDALIDEVDLEEACLHVVEELWRLLYLELLLVVEIRVRTLNTSACMGELIEVVREEGLHHECSVRVSALSTNLQATSTFNLDLDDLKLALILRVTRCLRIFLFANAVLCSLLILDELLLLVPFDGLVQRLPWAHAVEDLTDASLLVVVSDVDDLLGLEAVVLIN